MHVQFCFITLQDNLHFQSDHYLSWYDPYQAINLHFLSYGLVLGNEPEEEVLLLFCCHNNELFVYFCTRRNNQLTKV